MKKILPFLLCTLPLFSALVNMPKSPGGSNTPTTKPTETTHPTQTTPQPSRPKLIIPPSEKTVMKTAAAAPIGDLFYYPGVLSPKEGNWVGSDNFVNLSKGIPVQVNFIKSEGAEISFTQEKFQTLITQIFDRGNISSSSNANPPLPFFNLLVLIFPTEDGLAASCEGRLFEKVSLDRVHFKDEVFQAITWVQSNLVVGSTEEFEGLLTTTIEGIANSFIKRLSAQEKK